MSQNKRYLRTFVKHSVNPLLRNLAYIPRGPFALLQHIGRRSGKSYKNPIMVWNVDGGFISALTYGLHVDWLRNLQAGGQGSLLWHKQQYRIYSVELIDANIALPYFPRFIRYVLHQRHVQDFIKLSAQQVSSPEQADKKRE